MPKRIQRKRTKGWRMPEGAVYVGRPTKWGNFRELQRHADEWQRGMAVEEYRLWYSSQPAEWLQAAVVAPLRGHDLACWCPIDQPCHADVLLELANGGPQC